MQVVAGVVFVLCLLEKSAVRHLRPKHSFSTGWFVVRSSRGL